ncbi:MAG TPA: hypothetical protein VIH27_04550, partial [Nitrososphaerales archaeon]
ELRLETTGLEMPLKGHFEINNENALIYESKVFDEIWGGDTISLQLSSAGIKTTSTTDSATLTTATNPTSEEGYAKSSTFALALVATLVVVALAVVMLIRRRNTV